MGGGVMMLAPAIPGGAVSWVWLMEVELVFSFLIFTFIRTVDRKNQLNCQLSAHRQDKCSQVNASR